MKYLLLFLAFCAMITPLLHAQLFDAPLLVSEESTIVPIGTIVMDIDADGDSDIIGFGLDEMFWYENLGAADSFSARQNIDTRFSPRSWHAADINGDGLEDLIIGDRDDNLVLLYGNTGGGFSLLDTLATPDGPLSVSTGDVDGDGKLDVLYGSQYEAAWLAGNGLGGFSLPRIVQTSLSIADFIGIQAVDINNDGEIDIAYGKSIEDKVVWCENFGGEVFGPEQSMPGDFPGVSALLAYDLNDDGDTDLIAASGILTSKIIWFENLGAGSFSSPKKIASGILGPQGLSVADLDIDGRLDVIFGSFYQKQVYLCRNLGGGLFAAKAAIDTGNSDNVYDLAIADVDEDGIDDLVVASTALPPVTDRFRWFRNSIGDSICSGGPAPVNLSSSTGASDVTLNWDSIPESIRCNVEATRIVPSFLSKTKQVTGYEVSTVDIPISQLGAGTTWAWQVGCTCKLYPPDETALSIVDTVVIPALRKPSAAKPSRMSPNPATNVLLIKANQTELIRIFDAVGREHYAARISGSETVDVSTWRPGIYFVHWTSRPGQADPLVVH